MPPMSEEAGSETESESGSDREGAGFTTAADLRERDGSAAARPDAGSPSTPDFSIPERPERVYPRHGGVRYEGGCVFELVPRGVGHEQLAALLAETLAEGPYRYGDWFDLPMPLFLVHDDETNDTFRAGVRDGRVELHVRPETTSAGPRALYERLDGATGCAWDVRTRTTS